MSVIGKDGDFYIDNLTQDFYLHEYGSWVLKGSLAASGGGGVNGLNLYNLAGPPDDAFGRDSESYIDNIGLHLYKRVAGHWEDQGTIKGGDGDPGAPGDDGAPGRDGYTIRGDDGEDGESGFPIPGQPGTDGSPGTDGRDGYTIRGDDGEDGEDGFSIPGQPGGDGAPGSDGAPGRDGYTIRGEDGEDGENAPLILIRGEPDVEVKGALRLNGNQAFSSGAVTQVLLDTQTFTPQNVIADTANSRLEIQTAGLYLIQANIVITYTGTNTQSQINILVNGTAKANLNHFEATNSPMDIPFCALLQLEQGDLLTLAGYNTSSAGGADAKTFIGNGATLPKCLLTASLLNAGPKGDTGDAGPAGPSNMPPVNVGTDKTFALSDAGSMNKHTSASAHAWTIPPNSSVPFAIGDVITMIVPQGQGAITVTRGSGVALYLAGAANTNANRTLSAVGMATIAKIDTDTWVINGAGMT
jgi:hypothetical protein